QRDGFSESVRRALAAWHARGGAPGWSFAVALMLAVLAVPIAAVLYLAATPGDNIWPHLVQSVLPGSMRQTLLLALGTGLVTLVAGTGTAWLVTMYRFPGRAVLDRLLVLPLAIPTYIAAYCYAELFDYAGPVQSVMRSTFGWTSEIG